MQKVQEVQEVQKVQKYQAGTSNFNEIWLQYVGHASVPEVVVATVYVRKEPSTMAAPVTWQYSGLCIWQGHVGSLIFSKVTDMHFDLNHVFIE